MAKGANAAAARSKIGKLLDETGVGFWDVDVQTLATPELGGSWPVLEDLPPGRVAGAGRDLTGSPSAELGNFARDQSVVCADGLMDAQVMGCRGHRLR
ncbi:hypothetical protein SAMN05661080_02488 [Modestobacter sp. DSM 44400]|uniref:hypothetical protein n=1 Tax=Modestobacter sp. DSM 44400 TaxID=1550230 RepID=UPI00089D67A5|nr:hypothetical protein [Modestobacter sp. DSM 44400]SDY15397.1 hypothetical protein SAMN05661080_02488 [Modestobacter sp. DSM 44400]